MCTSLPTIGVIGLGVMGLPMARHLCDAGYQVTVYNRTPAKMDAAKAFGAYTATSPRYLGERCDVLITMLTTPDSVRAVIDGPDGALSQPHKNLVWIQMSTLDVQSTHAFAAQAKECGVFFVDCPVTGSKKQVEAADLILLAGGLAEAKQFVRPILQRLGKTVIDAGPIGAGTTLKLCMNLIVAQMNTALAEATTFAEGLKIDPALIFQVLNASPALKCGLYASKEAAMLRHEFSPAFSLDNMAKDVGFIVDESAKAGIVLPVTQAAQRLYEKARAEGHGADDLSSIVDTLRPK